MPEKESYFERSERSLERDEKIREKERKEELKWGGDLAYIEEMIKILGRSLLDRLFFERKEIKELKKRKEKIREEIEKSIEEYKERLKRIEKFSGKREAVDMLFINPPKSREEEWDPDRKEYVRRYRYKVEETPRPDLYEKIIEWIRQANRQKEKTSDHVKFTLYSTELTEEGKDDQNYTASEIASILERLGIDLEKIRHPRAYKGYSKEETGLEFTWEERTGRIVPEIKSREIEEKEIEEFVEKGKYRKGRLVKTIDTTFTYPGVTEEGNLNLVRVIYRREPGYYGKTTVEIEVTFISKDFTSRRLLSSKEKE
jgi:hypothetical protein